MIEFRDVSMTYKAGINALRNVSFKINDGEFIFVIGKSGSGKSTLIKLLTCEENPTRGKVFIDDYEVSYLKRNLIPYLRRNIGMIFQDFRLIYSKTVYENVSFAMEIIGASKANIKTRVPIVLSIVGLRNKANMKPNQLSGGEQQRVAIARAMVNNPMLILADEPTGNLDPVNSESIMALLEEINCTGTTIIVCTHDSSIVNKMKRRVIEISDGSVVRDDKLGEYNLAVCKIPIRENLSRKNRKLSKPINDSKKEAPFVRNINIKLDNDKDLEKLNEIVNDEINEDTNENIENINENSKDDSEVLKKVYDYYSIKASEYMGKKNSTVDFAEFEGDSKVKNDKNVNEDEEENEIELIDFSKTIKPTRIKKPQDEDSKEEKTSKE